MDTTDTGIESGTYTTGDDALLRERGLEMLRHWMDRLEVLIRERPGATLLGALGLGFVIGRIIRR